MLELDYEVENVNNIDGYPPLIFDVYDEDNDFLDKTPDFLGRAIIEAKDAIFYDADMIKEKGTEIPSEPRWHPIRFKQGDPKCGEVLVSFCAVEHDFKF